MPPRMHWIRGCLISAYRELFQDGKQKDAEIAMALLIDLLRQYPEFTPTGRLRRDIQAATFTSEPRQ